MITYDTMNEAWVGIAHDIFKHGSRLESRDGGCTELTGFGFRLSNIDHCLATVRKASLIYAAAETLWYLSGSDDVRVVEAYAPQYRRFAQPGTNRAHGAYGKRWVDSPAFLMAKATTGLEFPSQLDAAVAMIKKSPNTRQCLVGMWDHGDLVHGQTGEINDIPCTVAIQFLLRNDKLHSVVTMRSNDLWLGTPYDVFAFTTFQRIVALRLGAEPGTYTHVAGSMHVYDRNRDKVIEARDTNGMGSYKFDPSSEGDLDMALELEQDARTGKSVSEKNVREVGGLAQELLTACCRKWQPTLAVEPSTDLLRNLL